MIHKLVVKNILPLSIDVAVLTCLNADDDDDDDNNDGGSSKDDDDDEDDHATKTKKKNIKDKFTKCSWTFSEQLHAS